MSYRPTVRYPDIYKDYVEKIFKATTLDRNQIIRLALFVAAHSDEYKAILKKHQTTDVPLPQPDWEKDEERCWKDQNYIKKTVPTPPIKIIEQGGIKIIIG
ncbi:hypothetical protein [Neobacillus cucumis]|uniref:hypothetical protein n=1 Tax=Neobacillus cucumis TaxID=1740721 RepID=UPI0019648599|nr:hypothetical protein [Neobacillus cucumis]MBM7655854.1 hypothetical protein [Neobacillus cucumis]